MFELIKKWFKRPIVINFTVEPLSSDAALNVVKTDSHLTLEAVEAFRKEWAQFSKAKAVILDSRTTLEQLSDADLHVIGLIRADFSGVATVGVESIPTKGTYLLDKSERVVIQSTNGDISRLINKDKNRSSR